MPYMTILKPALIRFGLGPYLDEVPDWETRGNPSFAPAATIGHHTAGPAAGDRPSLRVCVDGRPADGIPGPLCNDFLSRTRVILVAAGRANHAGVGGYRHLRGNSSVFGNEAESTGVLRRDGTPDWSDFQEWAFPRVHAAHLWALGRGAEWYIGHRDWTSRKIDPTGVDTTDMRWQIAKLLAADAAGDTTEAVQEDTMRLIVARVKGTAEVYVGNGITRRWVRSEQELADLTWQAGNLGIRVDNLGEVDSIDWLGVDITERGAA